MYATVIETVDRLDLFPWSRVLIAVQATLLDIPMNDLMIHLKTRLKDILELLNVLQFRNVMRDYQEEIMIYEMKAGLHMKSADTMTEKPGQKGSHGVVRGFLQGD